MNYNYYTNELEKAQEYALRGYDFTKDMYYAVMKTCKETSSWDERGKYARSILYTLRRNGWSQLKYISYRNKTDEEYYANQGYSLY